MGLVLLIHYLPTRGIPSPESIRLEPFETILNLELRSITFVCVNCFILISGYFGIKWKIKSFSRLIYLILFWSAISYMIATYLEPKGIYDTFLTSNNYIANTFTLRWFIGAYLCLYIIAPLMNEFINNSTQKRLARYIICFYIFSTIFGWIMKSTNFNEGMSELHLAGLYLIGAYLRKTQLKLFCYKPYVDLGLFLCLGFFLVALNISTLYIGISKSPYGYLNPIVITQSVYLFLFFKKLHVRHTAMINFIAASTFSAYLLHTDLHIRDLYETIGEWANTQGIFASLGIMVMVIGAVFLFCSIIDLIGNWIFNRCYKLLKLK